MTNPDDLKTADFDYFLPPELIAQTPSASRDGARMMVLHRDGQRIEHRSFRDLPAYLQSGDVIVLNATRVIAARLYGRKPDTGGRIEIFLLEPMPDGSWQCLLKAKRKPAPGSPIVLEDGRSTASIVGDAPEGSFLIRFTMATTLDDYLETHGHVPLPPYIKRAAPSPHQPAHINPSANDRDRYQTVYARESGSVAAPTAGLHFTPEMLKMLEAQGVKRAELVLHVGLGTFRPVKVDRIEDHVMHEERYEIGEPAARTIRDARAAGGRILAVGSTSVRTLETVASERGEIVAASGRTSIFIRPPHTFRAVDMMLTNFHLPKSTLLMMVSALAARQSSLRTGREFILHAYEEAVKERYRFFSYGDCMLIV